MLTVVAAAALEKVTDTVSPASKTRSLKLRCVPV
jgi:hypothetical protein